MPVKQTCPPTSLQKMARLLTPFSTRSFPISTPLRFSFPNPHPLQTLTLILTPTPRTLSARARLDPTSSAPTAAESTHFDLDFESLDDPDEGSPWEGAVVYRRDASVGHVEYSTSLERLGMGNLSTELSRIRASEMGIRVVPRRGAAFDPSLAGGTPVSVSVDVTRRKGKLKLDGIVRTVITLGCNRCAEPAAESIFSNFTLLLTDEPVEESDTINMGVIFGEGQSRTSSIDIDEDEDEKFIDPEDRLYFPAEEKEIDISKHIRDLVHVEITINAICDPSCKGLCLKCGINLNKSSCSCQLKPEQEGEFGPLKNLKKQMQQR